MNENINQITFYETPDGKIKIEVRFENENLWLSQKLMAALFECSADNISFHLKNIYETLELSEKSTTEDFSVVQIEGGRKVKLKTINPKSVAEEFSITAYNGQNLARSGPCSG